MSDEHERRRNNPMWLSTQRHKKKRRNAVITGSCLSMFSCCSRRAQTLCLGSSETDSFLRPFSRRRASTLRPLAVDIRSRNPCLFFLLRFEGWNVLFISQLLNFPIKNNPKGFFETGCKSNVFFYSAKQKSRNFQAGSHRISLVAKKGSSKREARAILSVFFPGMVIVSPLCPPVR